MKIYTILFLAIVTQTTAQQPLNLGFEMLSMDTFQRPWGWDIQSGNPAGMAQDSTVVYAGKYSLQVKNETPELLSIGYTIEPYELKNKTVEFSGMVKTDRVVGRCFVKAGYGSGTSVNPGPYIDTTGAIFTGTHDWQPVSIRVNIPEKVDYVNLILHLEGTGTAWFDDFSLKINGKKVEQVQVAKPFSKKEFQWLKQQCTPLVSVDATPPGQTPQFSDLQKFGEIAADATIIALGESTHGTAEFFRLKHRLFEYAVENLGVRMFAIEANMLTGENINRFVRTGKGTARGSMYGLFSVWQNREVHDLIQWMRDYNVAHPDDMVEFVAFDMQDFYQPYDSLMAFLGQYDPQLQKEAMQQLADLKTNMPNSYNASDSLKNQWFIQVGQLFQHVENKRSVWLKTAKTPAETDRIEWGIQYARLLKQFAESLYRGHVSLYRDVAMAENVNWLLSRRKPGAKMVIWAHDYHVSRGEDPQKFNNMYEGRSMGTQLAARHGARYKTFGLESYTGAYRAQKNYFTYQMYACPLFTSPVGSVDEALHRIAAAKKSPGLFLDLRTARRQSWLCAPLPMRFGNHVNFEYAYWTRYSLPYQFDGVFFWDVTGAARSY